MVGKLKAKAARVQAGLNQEEVASRLGRSPATIVAWENGKTHPRMNDAAKYAEAIGFRLEDIYFD